MAKATLLLTSAGSGVGRCVLDALEGRRAHLRVIGADLDPACPALGECDEIVLLPATSDASFAAAVAAVCSELGVDLVIPCRDPDVLALAPLVSDPATPITLAAPGIDLVAVTRDKWDTFRWCRQQGIPFAPTVATDDPDAAPQAQALVRRWGFPLICKPRSGAGSLGVRALTNDQHLRAALEAPGMILQPFLSPPESGLSVDASAGVPLFWEIPCPDEPGIMALIGPQGELGPYLCFTAEHRIGRNERLSLTDDPGLASFARQVLGRFQEAGWRGPLNLQCRRGPDGWYLIEINPRFSGGTSARLHMGLDEVGWIVNSWIGHDVVPAWTQPPVTRVERYLRELPSHIGAAPRGPLGGAETSGSGPANAWEPVGGPR